MKQLTISIDDIIVDALAANGFAHDAGSQVSEDEQKARFAEAAIAEMLRGLCGSYRATQAIDTARATAAAMPPIDVTVEIGS